MLKNPRYKGCLYSIKVSGPDGGSVHGVFAQALQDAFLEEGRKIVPDDLAQKVAHYLIDECKIGASAQEPHPPNRIHLLEGMIREARLSLDDAAEKAMKGNGEMLRRSHVARGRLRGLAQALAMIRAPRAWMDASQRARLALIVAEEVPDDATE